MPTLHGLNLILSIHKELDRNNRRYE
jgi:hypothetical protein